MKFRNIALAMAAVGFINVGMRMAIREPAKLSELCTVDSTGNVVVDKVAVGTIAKSQGDYFVEEDEANFILLSKCYKGGCGPFDQRLLREHVGAPVRAEFCSKHAAKLIISDKLTFQLTQQYLDDNLATIQRNGRLMSKLAFYWIGFWLVLLVAVELRTRTRSA
ncbi:hypothetical protein [Burkholderia lata]|uniref:hypothetical protein n=1 Tax=Burkholderia lata (strain ATCC 17760 / DSM 23089 / LMG 22485 / NCIMB 9086 / R18194 / 383) TaxID=482957 RepID=UPI0014547B43|nr:hypothetical protein [Burkholderia lata]VWL95640.1 hypothetical protein BLA6992_01132 [Burkholderia lata]